MDILGEHAAERIRERNFVWWKRPEVAEDRVAGLGDAQGAGEMGQFPSPRDARRSRSRASRTVIESCTRETYAVGTR